MQKALVLANEAQLNNYGYQLLQAGKTAEALTVFQRNVKTHPNSWNVYDSLAEAYEKSGDKKNALKNYQKA
jgi:Flp pilus assembly protein TadD